MKNDKVVVMPAHAQPYNKEYIANLRVMARASVDAIKEKPTLEDLFTTVDKCWDNPIFVKQTAFQNKDQHYAYITEYYHSTIENLTLEQYKQLVYSDLMNKIDSAEALLDSDKILAAAKEHKAQEAKHLKEYQNQIDDLKDRNEKAMKDIFKND